GNTEKGNTAEVAFYDMRTNMESFGKTRQLKKSDFMLSKIVMSYFRFSTEGNAVSGRNLGSAISMLSVFVSVLAVVVVFSEESSP
ncbi:MAG: hypothetical protein II037_05110, partial [Bacteroidales bacterium]|nr:hypothetical protein [Bacteroidales bacterium]